MRRPALCLAAAGFLLSAGASEAAFSPPATPPVRIARPLPGIPDGETLVYTVRWLGIPIGRAWVRVRKSGPPGQERHLIVARARANDFLMAFYPVRDLLRGQSDGPGFRARWSEKNLKEGR